MSGGTCPGPLSPARLAHGVRAASPAGLEQTPQSFQPSLGCSEARLWGRWGRIPLQTRAGMQEVEDVEGLECVNLSRPLLRPQGKPGWARGSPRAPVPSCCSHGAPERLCEGQRCGSLLSYRQQCSRAKRTPRLAAGVGERGEHARTPPESSARLLRRPRDRPVGVGVGGDGLGPPGRARTRPPPSRSV